MLFGKRFLVSLGVFLMCTASVPAQARFFRPFFGGVNRRIARRQARRFNRNFNNNQFFLPLQNQFNGNGFGGFGNTLCDNGGFNNLGLHGNFSRFGGSSFINPALSAGLGGFGHCVVAGQDAGFPQNFAGGQNPAFGGQGLDGNGANAQCRAFLQEPCQQGPTWACSMELAKGWSIDITGPGMCAINQFKYQSCLAGVNWSEVNSTNSACWVPGNVSGNPVADFSKSTPAHVNGQVVLVLSDDFGADKVKAWMAAKQSGSSIVQRFQRRGKADVLLLNTAPGQEFALCDAARKWNPQVVQSCAPNILPTTGVTGAGGAAGTPAGTGATGGTTGGAGYTF